MFMYNLTVYLEPDNFPLVLHDHFGHLARLPPGQPRPNKIL